ncbi:MAG: MarC family protein, partial [Methylacidiphilaceae bacterium]|nr:MarC family protein [Candidatus Methylacidiphilaceae bacterium]
TLLSIAYDMLMGQRSAIQGSSAEKTIRGPEDDVAVSPLAIPILAGPGAISNSVLLAERAHHPAEKIVVLLVIGLVMLLTYGLFYWAAKTGTTLLGPKVFRITTRLMGLLLAAFAVQFLLNGIRAALAEPS